MEGGRNRFLVSILLAALLSQNVVFPVMCCEFCIIPSYGTPPSHSGGGGVHGRPPTPSHHGGGAYGRPPTPSHHGGGAYGRPPTPSHRRGGGHVKPPSPAHHGGGGHVKPPSPAHHGGGGHVKPPSPAHHGGGGHVKPPSPAHHGGGAYGKSPPPHGKPCPPTRHRSKPPSRGGGHKAPPSRRGGGYSSPPPRPIVSPPHTPSVPVPPAPIITPTPRVPIVDPSIHPITGTCTFWRTHPALIWGVIGYWGTIGGLFGMPTIHTFGFDPTILQALGCRRTDGYGALLREGAASFLNSLSSRNFPFTNQQVKETFVASLASEQMASAQAQRFKLANEGHLKN